MKQLSKLQNFVFLMGGALMVVGVALNFFGVQQVGACVFLIGAVCFGVMQMLQRYEGQNVTIRRLRRILVTSDVLFLLTAVLMFASQSNAFGIPQVEYVLYVHNKWIGTLLLAAIIQLYAINRLDSEVEKEAKKR
jgi:drug/metabolite transporter (DMT)-like permease